MKDSSKPRSPSDWTSELRAIEDAFLNRMLITVIGHGDGELLFNARLGTSLHETVRAGFLSGAATRQRVGCAGSARRRARLARRKRECEEGRRGGESGAASRCAGATSRT